MTPRIFLLLGRSCKKMALNKKIQIKLVAVMQQSVGHNDPDVQKLPNEPAFLLASGVGLLFEQNLADGSDEHCRKGHHITKSRSKLNVHRTYSPPFPQ